MTDVVLEYLRSFGLFWLWQVWQSSGPGGRQAAHRRGWTAKAHVERHPAPTHRRPAPGAG